MGPPTYHGGLGCHYYEHPTAELTNARAAPKAGSRMYLRSHIDVRESLICSLECSSFGAVHRQHRIRKAVAILHFHVSVEDCKDAIQAADRERLEPSVMRQKASGFTQYIKVLLCTSRNTAWLWISLRVSIIISSR